METLFWTSKIDNDLYSEFYDYYVSMQTSVLADKLNERLLTAV